MESFVGVFDWHFMFLSGTCLVQLASDKFHHFTLDVLQLLKIMFMLVM